MMNFTYLYVVSNFLLIRSNNRGNFIEILKWSSATDLLVNSILLDSADNASYLSPSIQNELIHLMANQIRKQIAEKVNSFKYSLIYSTINIFNIS